MYIIEESLEGKCKGSIEQISRLVGGTTFSIKGDLNCNHLLTATNWGSCIYHCFDEFQLLCTKTPSVLLSGLILLPQFIIIS